MNVQIKPGWLMNNEKGSFAESTILQRKPQILERLIAENSYEEVTITQLRKFKIEIASGFVSYLNDSSHDAIMWNAELRRHGDGCKWLDLPWFFAESYFYRRLLEITGFFLPDHPGYHQDPFRNQKEEQTALDIGALLETNWLYLEESQSFRFTKLLHASLWGNRADLSNTHVELGHTRDEYSGAAHLVKLIDDTAAVETFCKRGSRNIVYFLDNVGRELFSDLALIDFLLSQEWASRIVIAAKPAPFFVSDAMVADVKRSISVLAESTLQENQGLAASLDQSITQGRLVLEAPEYLSGYQMYCEMPSEFHAWMAGFDLAIFKGDANYRRVVEDRHWPFATDIREVTGCFHTNLLLVRTLKSELMLGLPPGVGDELSRTNPGWLIRGDFGLIQFINKMEVEL
ncbi:MAG: protein-glutamate O-methyltransferase family protein [Anaerolineae bacterium]|nr:protein-glutamate O-methyltransferase family protein [Anaerolineae bacterium]